MARTPHLRTTLSSAEIADAVSQAADLITALTKEVAELKEENLRLDSAITAEEKNHTTTQRLRQAAQENYENLLADWNADQEEKAELNRKLAICRHTIQGLRADAQSRNPRIGGY